MSVTPDFAGLGAHDAAASAFSSWGNIFNTLWSSGGSHGWPRDEDLAKDPKRLASICGPINARMIKEMNYSGAPVLKAEAVESLLEYMYRRSVEFGVPLDTPISSKGFRLGYSLGLVSSPPTSDRSSVANDVIVDSSHSLPIPATPRWSRDLSVSSHGSSCNTMTSLDRQKGRWLRRPWPSTSVSSAASARSTTC